MNIEKKIDFLNKWNSLDKNHKNFVIQLNKNITLKNNKHINEANTINTVLDVAGIFDPTGIADLTNAILYVNQGDYLFGFLSAISAIPYVGDVVAKPLIGIGKSGRFAKSADAALKIVKNGGDTAQAAKLLKDASQSSGMFRKLVTSSNKWGPKLKNAIDNVIPTKITSGLRKVMKDWVDLFMQVGTKREVAKRLTGIMASKLSKPMSKKEAEFMIKQLQKQLNASGKIFRNMKFKKGDWAGQISAGLTFGLLWRNRAVTSLARRSKLYLGFLDFLGLGNFVGPEELSNKEKELEKKWQEYLKTNEGKQNAEFDFQEVDNQTTTTSTEDKVDKDSPTTDKVQVDPVVGLLQQLLYPKII